MKIAVATTGPDESSRVSVEAARAPVFQIYDDKATLLEVIHNPFLDMSRLVGVQVAELIASKGVTVFIAGRFGHRLSEMLCAKGIMTRAYSGPANQVVENVLLDFPEHRLRER